jgi:hypothetical protein
MLSATLIYLPIITTILSCNNSKYIIISCKKKEFDDLEDLSFSFSTYFVIARDSTIYYLLL